MSAFQVSENHIGAILRWYLFDLGPAEYRAQWRDHQPTRDDAVDMAAALAFECFRSVNYRYPDAAKKGELPGPIAYGDGPVLCAIDNLGVYKQLTPVQAIKACHCLDYQSCEHPEWQQSEAKKLLDDIISAAVHHLPGYDSADWHIDDRNPVETISLFDLASRPRRR